MLLGQRFSIDSYVMSNLVYDRLFVDNEPVMRRFPATMDVIYVLGNDYALTHLRSELEEHEYGASLYSLRVAVDRLPSGFWQEPVYNQWLGLLRTLNQRPQSTYLPLAMHTQAWADKILSTQLTSWAQLRHDNILYAKQSYTMDGVVCEYPAGYVEPYPKFYRAVHQFAADNYERIARLDSGQDDSEALGSALTYFRNVMEVMEQLETLASKELEGRSFTAEEEAFLKSIVRYQLREVDRVCAIVTEEYWDGWYPTLFYRDETNPAVVADVHTNPTTDETHPLYPPGVLHVASGPVVPIIMIVNTDEGTTMYVGPAMTYFVKDGFPFIRLNDKEWQERLNTLPYPTPPAWTTSFRHTTSEMPRVLELPMRIR